MNSRKIAVFAGLAAAWIGIAVTAPAQAQPSYFGVGASAETLGYPGTSRQDVFLPNEMFADALSDPPAVVLRDVWGNSASADLGTGSDATPGHVHAWASSETEAIGGQYASTSIYAHGYAHFYDRITVKSDVLPFNTPVTLVFDNAITLHQWTCSGLCDGYIDETLQIGASTAHSRWAYWYGSNPPPKPRHQPQLTVTTKVGATLTIDSKLRVRAKTFFFLPGYGFGGEMKADATATVVLSQAPEGVWIESVSGADYMPVSN